MSLRASEVHYLSLQYVTQVQHHTFVTGTLAATEVVVDSFIDNAVQACRICVVVSVGVYRRKVLTVLLVKHFGACYIETNGREDLFYVFGQTTRQGRRGQ